jgi:hypothetical protein
MTIVLAILFAAFCVWFQRSAPEWDAGTVVSEFCSRWETFQEYLVKHGWRVTLYIYVVAVVVVLARVALSPRKTGKVVLWGAVIAIIIAGCTTWAVLNVPCGARAMKHLEKKMEERSYGPTEFATVLTPRSIVLPEELVGEQGACVFAVGGDRLRLPNDAVWVQTFPRGEREGPFGSHLWWYSEGRSTRMAYWEQGVAFSLRRGVESRTWLQKESLVAGWVDPERASELVAQARYELAPLSDEELFHVALAADVMAIATCDDPAEIARTLVAQFVKEYALGHADDCVVFEMRNGVKVYVLTQRPGVYDWPLGFKVYGFAPDGKAILDVDWDIRRKKWSDEQMVEEHQRIATFVEGCEFGLMGEVDIAPVAEGMSSDATGDAVRLSAGGNGLIRLPREGLTISATPYEAGYRGPGLRVEAMTPAYRIVLKSLDHDPVNPICLALRDDAIRDDAEAQLQAIGFGDEWACERAVRNACNAMDEKYLREELFLGVLGVVDAPTPAADDADAQAKHAAYRAIRKTLGEIDLLTFETSDEETVYVLQSLDADGDESWIYSFWGDGPELVAQWELLDVDAPKVGSPERREYVRERIEAMYFIPEPE